MLSSGDRLPRPFLRLWASDALTTAGDGFTLVAGPLLLTTLTDNPVLISAGAFAALAPWLLFGLHAGALVDRSDQRSVIMRVDVVRALLMAGLAVTILTGGVSVALVYVLLFASGCGDTLVVTAGTSLVPQLVARSQLTRANSRLIATRMLGGFLIARPLGAWLFTQGHATPFLVDALSFLAGVVLLIGVPSRPVPVGVARRGAVREGLRILWDDAVLRVLALCIFVMNVTLTATMAVLVIYARDRLALSATGYGALGACLAVGGLAGTALVGPLLARYGTSLLLKAGLVIEAGTQLCLALTTSAWIAGGMLIVFGVHGSVWSVLTTSLRQHRAAEEVRGRVMAAYNLLSVGGAAFGALLGGVLVAAGSITTPMWFGAVLVSVVFALAVPSLRRNEVELETSAGVR